MNKDSLFADIFNQLNIEYEDLDPIEDDFYVLYKVKFEGKEYNFANFNLRGCYIEFGVRDIEGEEEILERRKIKVSL